MTDEIQVSAIAAGRDIGAWTPEALAAQVASGQCAIVPGDWCVTHATKADFGHYLDTRPAADNGHNPVSGIAYND